MTDAELALLSLVAEAPITGYDLQTLIDRRNIRMWTLIGVESLYYVLEKLERQGLIEAVENRGQNTASKLFRATAAGLGVLQTAIMDLLSTPRQTPQSFELGLANLHVLRTEQVRHALQTYGEALLGRLGTLRMQLATLHEAQAPFHVLSMYEHQLAIVEAETRWFEAWLPHWEAQAPTDEAPIVEAQTFEADLPRMQQRIMPQDVDSFHKQATRSHPEGESEGDPYATRDEIEIEIEAEAPPPPHHRHEASPPESTEADLPPPPQKRPYPSAAPAAQSDTQIARVTPPPQQRPDGPAKHE